MIRPNTKRPWGAMPLLVMAAASPCAFCDWLQYAVPTNGQTILSTSGSSVNVFFPSITGGGTFTVTGVSGSTGPAAFARDYGFHAPGLFSNWAANGLNPTNSDHLTIGTTGGCISSICGVNGTWDFTTIAGGVLPTGSDIVIWDLDVFETLSSLTATAGGPISGNVAWLTLISRFDGNGAATAIGANPSGVGDYASFATSGVGMLNYAFTVPGINTDIPTLHFRTNVPISTLSFQGGTSQGNRGYAFAIQTPAVPEPSTWAFMSVAGAGAFLLRRRRRVA